MGLRDIIDAIAPYLIAGAIAGFVYFIGPSPKKCSQFATQAECVAQGCYWWSDGTCHSSAQPPPPPPPPPASYGEITEITVF